MLFAFLPLAGRYSYSSIEFPVSAPVPFASPHRKADCPDAGLAKCMTHIPPEVAYFWHPSTMQRIFRDAVDLCWSHSPPSREMLLQLEWLHLFGLLGVCV